MDPRNRFRLVTALIHLSGPDARFVKATTTVTAKMRSATRGGARPVALGLATIQMVCPVVQRKSVWQANASPFHAPSMETVPAAPVCIWVAGRGLGYAFSSSRGGTGEQPRPRRRRATSGSGPGPGCERATASPSYPSHPRSPRQRGQNTARSVGLRQGQPQISMKRPSPSSIGAGVARSGSRPGNLGGSSADGSSPL